MFWLSALLTAGMVQRVWSDVYINQAKKDSSAMSYPPSSEGTRHTKHVMVAPPGTRPKAVGANKTKKKPNIVSST